MPKNTTIADGTYRVEFTARDELDGRVEMIAEILDGPLKGYRVGETFHTGYVREGHLSANDQKRRLYWHFFDLPADGPFDAEELLFRPFIAQIENGSIIGLAFDAFTHLPAGSTPATAQAFDRRCGWIREDEMPSYRWRAV